MLTQVCTNFYLKSLGEFALVDHSCFWAFIWSLNEGGEYLWDSKMVEDFPQCSMANTVKYCHRIYKRNI